MGIQHMSPKDFQKLLTQAGEAEFAEAIRIAKRKRVKCGKVLLEVEEQQNIAKVKCFALLCGVLSIFLLPYFPPLYQILCFKLGMECKLNSVYYYWPWICGFMSIISFGFNFVNPWTLERITGKPPKLRPGEHRIEPSGRYVAYGLPDQGEALDDGYEGDV